MEPEVAVTTSVYVPAGVPPAPALVLGVVAPRPPQPTPAMAIRSSGAASAGFHAFAPIPATICFAALSQALPLRNQRSIEVAGKIHNAGGAFIVPSGDGRTVARAAVLTLMETLAVDPGATLIAEAGPLHAAPAGAPVQVTVTLNGLPVAPSCNEQ